MPSKMSIWLLFSKENENVKQSKSWKGIQLFLKRSGYNVEPVHGPAERLEPDLLFICTDKEDDTDVAQLLSDISRGCFGLILKHEVLVSGPICHYPYGKDTRFPMRLGPDFMIYGCCMIHEHIRTLHDEFMMSGRHISMILGLEGKLVKCGIANTSDKNASDKIDAFKKLLESRGHADGEAQWVFAVLDMLRHTRNMIGHMPKPTRELKRAMETLGAINSLASEYRRGYLAMPPDTDVQDSYSNLKKWQTQLTQIASSWIDEYLEMNPPCNADGSGNMSQMIFGTMGLRV